MKNLSRVICCLVVLVLAIPAAFAMAGDGIETAGDMLSLLAPAAALAATYQRKDEEGRWQFAKSFLTSVGTTYGLKAIIDHDGPNGKSHSFPSGHSALAFSGASFLQLRYGWHYGLPAFLAAGFVGYSRVESDNHDWGDVAASAGISILSSLYFVSPQEKKVGLVPLADDRHLGLAMVGIF